MNELVRAPVDTTLRHRVAEATVTVLRDGRPLVDRAVDVEQLSHRFAFGNIGFDFLALANDERDDAPANVFGGATVAAAEHLVDCGSGCSTPRRSRSTGAVSSRILAGLTPLGYGALRSGSPTGAPRSRVTHWCGTRCAGWLRDFNRQVEVAQRTRIRREVSDFADVI
jgi:hypothetical protein